MTDRLKGFIVTLGEDMRDDDAEAIKKALGMVKGVSDVSPLVADHVDHMARVRVQAEMGLKIMAIIFPKPETAVRR